ncbi:hypothetical protein JEQ12_008071 [Ovis aries]|uniref:Uncharacterized protein n=1 Tax=Ovis aries TaxID=9940 RepID=A0A835ZR36_SHEEP|nr:hypothetical protein JEQ12_008071 [Ovis aries]
MAPHKGKEKKEEQVISLSPQVAEGENVFGVCHIFASETICRVAGGTQVKAGRDDPSAYAATLAAPDVAPRCKELGLTSPGPGAQSALRALACSGTKTGRIEDITPIPSDSTCRKGDRCGPHQ